MRGTWIGVCAAALMSATSGDAIAAGDGPTLVCRSAVDLFNLETRLRESGQRVATGTFAGLDCWFEAEPPTILELVLEVNAASEVLSGPRPLCAEADCPIEPLGGGMSVVVLPDGTDAYAVFPIGQLWEQWTPPPRGAWFPWDDLDDVESGLEGYIPERDDPSFIPDLLLRGAIRDYLRDWGAPVSSALTPELVARLTGAHPDTQSRWLPTVENPDCLIWSHEPPLASQEIAWSGTCVGGRAHGSGVVQATHVDHGTRVAGYRYEGTLADGYRHGRGVLQWEGAVYEGGFADGLFHGLGTLRWPGGASYEGDWVEDEMHGRGIMRWSDGTTQEGRYERGKFVGP